MARWGDIAKWVGPTKNSGDGDKNEHETADRMTGHDGVVLHIAAGYYQGTIAWQRNPNAEVSSHFIVGKTAADPTVQMVDTDDRSWAQRDGNSRWLSIEMAGFVGDKLTPYQVEQAARILAKAHQVYGVPLQVTNNPKTGGLGHHSMGAENGLNWGHSACPGPAIKAQKPAIVARAKQIVNGVQEEDDMTPEQDERLKNVEKFILNLDGRTAQGVAYLRISGAPETAGKPGERNGYSLTELHEKFDKFAARPAPGTVVIDKDDLKAAIREVLREGVGQPGEPS